jgi:dGTPase
LVKLPQELLKRGERWRAPWAANPLRSRGRLHAEPEDPLRSPFQRDRDRILHSNAFRRLKHKTQVFVHDEGDHYRTRLTHSLEVAQIARSIARPLGLDEDLAEAVALSHDLGHPPFGHAGERALDEALAAHGGFDHNAQSLRVVTFLERRYPDFDGLNLTLETLEGLVKHNGPLLAGGRPAGAYLSSGLPFAMRDFGRLDALAPELFAGLEAQAAAIADDIAYDTHDIEDGLRAGILTLADLRDVPLAGDILASIARDHPDLDSARTVHELTRRLIATLLADVLAETYARLQDAKVDSPEAVHHAGYAFVAFSPEIAAAEAKLKAFLFASLYRTETVLRPARIAGTLVVDLFAAFLADPSLMPEPWSAGVAGDGSAGTARRVGDYIAGMTDRYAVGEHRRLFDDTPDLV